VADAPRRRRKSRFRRRSRGTRGAVDDRGIKPKSCGGVCFPGGHLPEPNSILKEKRGTTSAGHDRKAQGNIVPGGN